ncbi:MAG: efflux RND transporter periplasmic adaptor subunit [Burkholderiales bacterium]|jgi:multidrug efflux system membrane fusion protein|nr:efflux RND transporter periplasmic adaptor subunit [Burkholderiales bacterium]
MKRLIMVLVFAVIAAAVAGGYWYWQQSSGAGASGAEKGKKGKGGKGGGATLTVKAVRAVTKPMPVMIEAVGTVEPEQSVQVRAQVSGVLQNISFKEGDKVKAGQLLFQIDPRTFQSQYNQAVAALARDRAQLENARAQQQRLEPLLKREFITQQEYDVAVTSAKSLEATVQSGQAMVEQARIQLDYSRIVAPISGRTGQLAVRAGNLVNAAGSGVPLVTINSTDPILVGFSIPERQLEDIRRYQNEKDMRIEILPDRAGGAVATGKLVFVDNTVTPQTGTVLLKTRVENTKELIWPGQFVNVRVVLTIEPEAVVVPEVAVQPGQEGPFVYLVGAEDKVEIRPVKVSRQLGNEIVIASGIAGGDQVITEIPQALRPGATVRIADATAEGGEKRKGKGKGGKKGEGKGDSEGGKTGAAKP